MKAFSNFYHDKMWRNVLINWSNSKWSTFSSSKLSKHIKVYKELFKKWQYNSNLKAKPKAFTEIIMLVRCSNYFIKRLYEIDRKILFLAKLQAMCLCFRIPYSFVNYPAGLTPENHSERLASHLESQILFLQRELKEKDQLVN